MKCYKLTTSACKAKHGDVLWGEGVTHSAADRGKPVLCTATAIHAYTSDLLAALMDPIHGEFGPDALLWECEGHGEPVSDGVKLGFASLTTLRQIPLPVITREKRERFALRAALAVRHLWGACPEWDAWAAEREACR